MGCLGNISMKIDVVFIAHNRLDYTKRALASVLAEENDDFRVTIWDNGSSDGTAEYLRTQANHKRVKEAVFCRSNLGQVRAVNEIWGKSKADLVGKLDNDCILPQGWSTAFSKVHEEVDILGAMACWPFFADDFDYQRAKGKIQRFGTHQLLRHPWTCGTGFLIKRQIFTEIGQVEGSGMTGFFLTAALRGYVNGFYYPLFYQEHMDDPKSTHCQIKTDDGFQNALKVTAGLQSGRFKDLSAVWRYRETIIKNLLEETYEPKNYVGWRSRIRQGKRWLRSFAHRPC
jgi:glycosyltransferase involved in cell wall biosynthesis